MTKTEVAEEVCNIGPRERRKRRTLGYVSLAVAVAAAFVLVVMDAPRWWRAVVFFPVWMAGLGLLQARERTCIALAGRGLQNLDAGEEEIADHSTAERLRETARRIHRRALLTAVAITLVAVAFPELDS
ncbi:MAG TPA: hypothetical protein VEY09_17970 [Pyrinomonadaceae bacterium]|nr:hypothetical protein [Pyrinomonadaceae bacterium]